MNFMGESKEKYSKKKRCKGRIRQGQMTRKKESEKKEKIRRKEKPIKKEKNCYGAHPFFI